MGFQQSFASFTPSREPLKLTLNPEHFTMNSFSPAVGSDLTALTFQFAFFKCEAKKIVKRSRDLKKIVTPHLKHFARKGMVVSGAEDNSVNGFYAKITKDCYLSEDGKHKIIPFKGPLANLMEVKLLRCVESGKDVFMYSRRRWHKVLDGKTRVKQMECSNLKTQMIA